MILICFVICESSKRFSLILFSCLPTDFNQSKTSDKCQIDGLPIWIGAGNDEISELNNFGIIDTQKETFEEMYHKISSDISSLDEDFFNSSIEIMDLFRVVKYLSGNVFFTHNSLLKKTPYNIYPTGTCLPFGKNICHCEGEYISLWTNRSKACIRTRKYQRNWFGPKENSIFIFDVLPIN